MCISSPIKTQQQLKDRSFTLGSKQARTTFFLFFFFLFFFWGGGEGIGLLFVVFAVNFLLIDCMIVVLLLGGFVRVCMCVCVCVGGGGSPSL